jgi:uncharacterized protein YhaN
MRIRELHVERFGVWRDLTLPLAPAGLNVFYGPNEAGKSTLLRFVRGVLYGFPPPDAGSVDPRPQPSAGELRVVHGSQDWTIRRESRAGTRGVVTVSGPGADRDPEALLAAMLHGTGENQYRNVFAIGLAELQELATLGGTDVAEHIYGASLGADGRRLLGAIAAARGDRQHLLDEERRAGALVGLARRIDEIDGEIESLGASTEQHAMLLAELQRRKDEIADQKRRQSGLQQQLRGHVFLERVWGPWNRHRRLLEQRDALPAPDEPSGHALDRFDEVELQIEESESRRQSLRSEFAGLRREAAALSADVTLARSAPVVRCLLRRRDALRPVRDSLPERRRRHDELRRDLSMRVERLGPGWSSSRLRNDVDDSPQAALKLLGAAQVYRSALTLRQQFLRRYRRLASTAQQRQLTLSERLSALPATTVADAQGAARRRIAALEELASLETRHCGARQALDLLEQRRSAADELPKHFFAALAGFGLAGAGLVLFGIVNAVRGSVGHTPWIVGTIFMLLGVCLGGVAWTIKRRLDPQPGAEDSLRLRIAAAEGELREIDAARDVLRTEPKLEPGGAGQTATLIIGVLAEARRGLAELDDLAHREQQQQSLRRRLSAMRETLRDRQRAASDARRDWCVTLRECGLDESVRIASSLMRWQELTEARRIAEECAGLQATIERDEQWLGHLEDAVGALSAGIDGPSPRPERAADRLAAWELRLAAADGARERRRDLRRQAVECRRDATRLARTIARLRKRCATLLSEAGVSDRAGLAARHEAFQRRRELEQQVAEAAEELGLVARTEPELAVVEEDLLALDPVQNRAAIDTIQSELDDLGLDLEQSHEALGSVRRRIVELESDRRPAELRYARSQCVFELEEAAERLAAIDLAVRAMSGVRDRLEREAQPATLGRAAEILRRLTGGRYVRVWRPLEEHRLLVDDATGQAVPVEHLSNGTREQLFLSLRLALIREFAAAGTEVPLVLDDIFVNFDQVRTEACVRVLSEFASGGPQVLVFTCHLHLAQVFEALGARTVWLPGHGAEREHRRVG